MIRRSKFQVAWAFGALLLVTAGCATGGGGGGQDSPEVRVNVGVSTAADMEQQAGTVLSRYQFPVLRTVREPVPLVESEWRNQTPTQDEQELGVTEIQCRILVRGRERSPSGGLRLYEVTFHMESQVKTPASPEWTLMPVTSQRTRFAREIAGELQISLEMVRR